MKENKKRIIFWFIVMVICFSLSLFGRKSFNEGYGKYGTVKKILDPIAVEFNTNDMVVRYDDLRAEVKKDKLVVSYMAYVNGKKKKINYVFDYVNNNGVEYITNTDENDNQIWSFIALQMANSVYHLNGGTGSIFDLYDYNVFETTTLLDGLIYNEGRKTVTINIRTNVVKNIYGKIDSKKDDVFASEEDLFNMQSDLSTQTYFRFVKEDINMYVRSVNDSYELYIAVTENNRDRALKSLANAIKILKPNVYATIVDENGNINFSPDSTDYQMNANVTFSEAGIYQTNDSILEIVINK